ncbi:MAG: polysaccharide biosynthesis protein, partial [Firmicutes bacterium]|nr:polysaccharide biosynthesis protein [Bacillota bacterium]
MSGFNGKLKRAVMTLTDIILVGGSLYLALFLRFEGLIPVEYVLIWRRLLLPVILLNLFIFLFAGIYRRLWRYASVDELLVIF